MLVCRRVIKGFPILPRGKVWFLDFLDNDYLVFGAAPTTIFELRLIGLPRQTCKSVWPKEEKMRNFGEYHTNQNMNMVILLMFNGICLEKNGERISCSLSSTTD